MQIPVNFLDDFKTRFKFFEFGQIADAAETRSYAQVEDGFSHGGGFVGRHRQNQKSLAVKRRSENGQDGSDKMPRDRIETTVISQ